MNPPTQAFPPHARISTDELEAEIPSQPQADPAEVAAFLDEPAPARKLPATTAGLETEAAAQHRYDEQIRRARAQNLEELRAQSAAHIARERLARGDAPNPTDRVLEVERRRSKVLADIDTFNGRLAELRGELLGVEHELEDQVAALVQKPGSTVRSMLDGYHDMATDGLPRKRADLQGLIAALEGYVARMRAEVKAQDEQLRKMTSLGGG